MGCSSNTGWLPLDLLCCRHPIPTAGTGCFLLNKLFDGYHLPQHCLRMCPSVWPLQQPNWSPCALQAIGATTPAWTAVLGWCLYGSRETVMTYSTLIPLMLGIVINTGFEPSFNLIGFTACMVATAARALKSVMQVGHSSQTLLAMLTERHLTAGSAMHRYAWLSRPEHVLQQATRPPEAC